MRRQWRSPSLRKGGSIVSCVRGRKHASLLWMLGVASIAFLSFMAGAIAPLAFAQSARPSELTSAMLGLQHEFPETLHKITPELLSLQQRLIDELRLQKQGTEEEERVGQRTAEEVLAVSEVYFRELETLRVIAALSSRKGISDREILKVRIEVRSEALAFLKRFSQYTEQRFNAGEVLRTDLARMKVRALKAEIMLEALKGSAGR